MGRLERLRILSYRGIGRADRLRVRGRVVVDRGATLYERGDNAWDDIVKMYRRLRAVGVPEARVRVSAAGVVTEAETDRVGFFDVELKTENGSFSSPRQQVQLELVEPTTDGPAATREDAVVRSPSSSFLIVSDIDDTIVHTSATSLVAMLRATFFSNARRRKPFAGIGPLYRALVAGASGSDDNPLVFISRSPWNLYDLFDQFCDLNGIPDSRVLFLRRWGISAEGLTRAKTKGHKFNIIQRVLELEPDLPVILIGDSGQRDPEIYHAISQAFPGRFLAAFIRDVSHSETRAAAIVKIAKQIEADGALLYLAEDSLDIARCAAMHGWIRPEAVASVDIDMR